MAHFYACNDTFSATFTRKTADDSICFINYDAICFLLFLYIEYKKSKGRTLIRKHWISYSVNGRIKVKSTIKVTNRTVETNIDIQYLKLVSRL